MSIANPRLRACEFTHGRKMNGLSSEELVKMAEIFGVLPENVRGITHPLVPECPAAAITFDRGGNVADALASYFNHEFYEVDSSLAAQYVYRSPNEYSFVDESEFGTSLVLTISEVPSAFLKRLSDHQQDIRFVALHPEILFMMRPRMSYDDAKSRIKQGYELVL
jgi:hypothetical protein